MTEPRQTHDESEDAAMRALVKRALEAEQIVTPDILRGVQRRLGKRPHKILRHEGWSTSAARVTYVLVVLFTLLAVAFTYIALTRL
jgi:predicted anti-sigma-YlaC factor YlaD